MITSNKKRRSKIASYEITISLDGRAWISYAETAVRRFSVILALLALFHRLSFDSRN